MIDPRIVTTSLFVLPLLYPEYFHDGCLPTPRSARHAPLAMSDPAEKSDWDVYFPEVVTVTQEVYIRPSPFLFRCIHFSLRPATGQYDGRRPVEAVGPISNNIGKIGEHNWWYNPAGTARSHQLLLLRLANSLEATRRHAAQRVPAHGPGRTAACNSRMEFHRRTGVVSNCCAMELLSLTA